MFYLTPCIAKIAAVKSPVGGYESPINGVINMDYVYNRVLHAFKNKKYPEQGKGTEAVNDAISSRGLRWPLTGGEASQIKGRALAIDGMTNVMDFLEKLEDEEIEEPIDYLELRGCDESCAGGILVQGNRFLVADNLRAEAAAALNNCIFMQARFEKEGSLLVGEAIDLMEKVWGKDRFVNKEKDN